MPHSAVGRPALSARSCAARKGREPAPPVWHGLPNWQHWDLQRPKDLLCLPTQSLAHWCAALKGNSMGGGAGVLEWGSAGLPLGPSLPVNRLVPWAQDPASHRKTASQQELPSFQYGSFFFPFSSTSARALSLSFSLPSSPSLPIPPHPKCSLCSAGPGYGLAVSGPSRGVFPTVRQALVSRALCARWLVFTCARAHVP